MSRLGRVVVALAMIFAAAFVGLSAAPSASAAPYTNRPTLTFNSGLVVLGGTLKVTGKGFVPFELVTITIDKPTPVIQVLHANNVGTFTTTITVPGALLIGVHTVIATGQFANNGYDVAANSVIVVLPPPLISIPLAFQHPINGALHVNPIGPSTSPIAGIAIAAGIGGLAVLMV